MNYSYRFDFLFQNHPYQFPQATFLARAIQPVLNYYCNLHFLPHLFCQNSRAMPSKNMKIRKILLVCCDIIIILPINISLPNHYWLLTKNFELRFICPNGDLGDLASSYANTIGNIVFFPQRLFPGVETESSSFEICVPQLSISV